MKKIIMFPYARAKKYIRPAVLCALVVMFSYTAVATAALTFNATTITGDGALTLTGAASSVWDLGASQTLSLQTTNNGPITLGTGLLTVGGRMSVAASSSLQGFTFVNATGTSVTLSGVGDMPTVSSTFLTFTSATGTTFKVSGTGEIVTVSSTGVTFRNATGTTITTTGAGTFDSMVSTALDFAGAITIGGTNGTQINIGRSGQWVTFPGNASTTGSLAIGATGAPIAAHYSATDTTVGFGEIASSTCNEDTVTVTGAALGDTVSVSATSSIESSLMWNGFVSAASTVTIRMCNVSVAAVTPATSTWRVDVWNH